MKALRVHQFVEHSHFLLVILKLLSFIYICNWFNYFILTIYLVPLKKNSKILTGLNHIVFLEVLVMGIQEVFLIRYLMLLDFRKINMSNLCSA